MAETAADDYPGARVYVPANADLDHLRVAAQKCRGCPLHVGTTQTVFGIGPQTARLVFVGEQPGDQEDRRGQPFVGPAGILFNRALRDAGIDREQTYVTNAVKHFKFTQDGEGKRRIHQTPDQREVVACRPWLAAELRTIDPDVIVALGATAGKSLMGNDFRVTRSRGIALPWPPPGMAAADRRQIVLVPTVHPSAVLRADDRDEAYNGLVADLEVAARALTGAPADASGRA
ncbi:MAG TPA: UdgX family uracil-DNA binding protein [Acidothermaceae bacterium]|jgi:uracil-DNA glycosylase family protein|nr:UdgX family uracil-DNA binding protein [Acidothermaceae bacterium]